MAPIIDIVKSIAFEVGLEVPSVLYSSTERTWQKMGVMVNTCARQILEEYDWQRLIKTATVTGNDVLTAFPLPSDYDRMVQDASLWGPSFTWNPAQQVFTFNEWLALQSYDIETWQPRWGLFSGKLNVMPAVANGETLTYGYITNAIVNGTDPTQFTADTDTFALDDRLLRLSLIWNWKKSEGRDFQPEAQEYAEAMSRAKFKDPGARQTIISGRYTRYRWPTGQSFP